MAANPHLLLSTSYYLIYGSSICLEISRLHVVDLQNSTDVFYAVHYVEEDLNVVTNVIDANTMHVASIATGTVYMPCQSKDFEFMILIFIPYLGLAYNKFWFTCNDNHEEQ